MDRYTPTPEEIAEVCADIREGWTEQRWRCQSGHPDPWEPPVGGKYVLHSQKTQGSDLQR